MALNFCGEKTINELNELSGIASDSVFRVLDSGILADSIYCKPGTFVEWSGSAWSVSNVRYATTIDTASESEAIATKIDASAIAPEYDAESTYTADDVVVHNGSLYQAKADIETAEEWTADHWTAIALIDLL